MPQNSGPSPAAMSLISPTTTEPKIEPAADTSEGGGGGGVVGGIVHLTIPIVIPSVKLEQGVPSITVPPLVISADNNNKPCEIGSSPAIKAERTDERSSTVDAGGGTIDKQMPAKGNISISVDVIKDEIFCFKCQSFEREKGRQRLHLGPFYVLIAFKCGASLSL